MQDQSTPPKGFFKLRSAARTQLFTQHICLRKSDGNSRQLYIGPAFDAAVFWAEPLPDWPGAITLSVSAPPDILEPKLFLSTTGENNRVDLWGTCGSDGRQLWEASQGKQADHWHFSVVGGNSKDTQQVQLSIGTENSDKELVDLSHEHTWVLHPASPCCEQIEGGPPTGFFRIKSAEREKLGCEKQWLGLLRKAEPQEQLKMKKKQDSAAILCLTAVPGGSNRVTIQLMPRVPMLYVSVQHDQPVVELYQAQDGSGRQIWNVHQAKLPSGRIGCKLSVRGGHHDAQGRHSLSCGLAASDEDVNLSQDHCWFMEEVLQNSKSGCVVQ